MAVQPRYAGAALCKVDYGSGLANLGYTEDGAQVTPTAYWADVPGDENGGPEGPPIDVQYLGETVDVRLVLTSWETTVADAMAARLAGGTAGTPGTPGTLMFLDQTEYQKQIGRTAMTDFRWLWKGDFEAEHIEDDGEAFVFVIKAHKPVRA